MQSAIRDGRGKAIGWLRFYAIKYHKQNKNEQNREARPGFLDY